MAISLDDLVKKRPAADKPRFISKKERERIALEREKSLAKVPVAQPVAQPVVAAIPGTETRTPAQTTRPARVQKRPTTGKNKFSFDWAAEDDTMAAQDDIYTKIPAMKSSSIEGDGPQARQRLQLLSKNKPESWENENTHWSKKPLDQMKVRDWRIFKEDFRILVRASKGDTASLPNPLRSWTESAIPREILSVVRSLNYKEPSAVQRAAIPIALEGKDVIGIAETGSGKTAAFVIPLLTRIMTLPRLTDETKKDGPYAIILAPTRELAQQIETEAARFCAPLGLRCVSVVGGRSVEEQIGKIDQGVEIVIATPGRLQDYLEQHYLVLNQCCYLVLDEADRMIDMGFEEPLNVVLSALPPTSLATGKPHQTMMFTATWPRAIESMSDKYLHNPGIVTVGSVNQATDHINQKVEFVQHEDRRLKRLVEVLQSGQYQSPIIIFVNYKRSCDLVAKTLNGAGWRTATMHGDKSQEQRERALAELKRGEIACLVATDVAGRGIDVPNVSLVVNFQMPRAIQDYTHRIGRTGRAGKFGVALTFLGPEDDGVLYELKQMIMASDASRVPEELRRHPAANARRALTS